MYENILVAIDLNGSSLIQVGKASSLAGDQK